MIANAKKTYLGDSVYINPDGFGGVVITTDNGEGPSNLIIMEPDTIRAFMAFIERMRDEP